MDDATNASNRRRSQRVILQVPILVKAEVPNGKHWRVQGLTLVVNSHVGLLESPLTVAANQKITLVNPQTGKEHLTFEEGTCAAWLHDLLKSHVAQVLVCDPRRNAR